MRNVIVLCLLASAPAAAVAQAPANGASPEREAVLTAVQRFFDTMAANDVAGSRAVMLPDGRFYAVAGGAPGTAPAVRSFTNQESIGQMTNEKRKRRERMWNPEVRIQGAIATVWTPYDFWIDGAFSHCGVDAFNLVKAPDGWKIAGGVYTVERTGCPPSPLGPLK